MNELLPFFTYAFVVTFTPGPNTITSMASSNRYGLKKTLPFMGGVFVGFLGILLLSATFNVSLSRVVPQAKPAMAWVGFFYMLYLAYKVGGSDVSNAGDEAIPLNSFQNGVLLQLVNVKAILYALTVVANFVIPLSGGTAGVIGIVFFLAFLAFLALLLWGFFGMLFRKFLSAYRRPFNLVMAGLLVYSALSLIGWV